MLSDYIILFTIPTMTIVSIILLITGGGLGAFIVLKFFKEVNDDYDTKVAKHAISNYCKYMGDKFPVLLEARRHILFLDEDGFLTRKRMTLQDHKKEMVKIYLKAGKTS